MLCSKTRLIKTSEDMFESLFKDVEERFENKHAGIDIHIQNIKN